MIGRKFEGFDAMIFPRCSSIHTYFMQQDLDIVFLDREKQVLSFRTGIKPWKMIFGPRNTETVIELPSNTLYDGFMHPRDILSW